MSMHARSFVKHDEKKVDNVIPLTTDLKTYFLISYYNFNSIRLQITNS